jgi:hypothetical protein
VWVWALELFVISCLWGIPLVLLHELGHAAAGLALTDGRVEVAVGERPDQLVLEAGRLQLGLSASPSPGGECRIDSSELRTPKAEAWIAAASPVASLLTAVVLLSASASAGAFDRGSPMGARVLAIGGGIALGQFFLSALPLRYGRGLGHGESDGRAIWRILTGAPPGGLVRQLRRESRPERVAHPAAVAVIVLIVAFTLFFLDPLLALVTAALFGVAWRSTTRTG